MRGSMSPIPMHALRLVRAGRIRHRADEIELTSPFGGTERLYLGGSRRQLQHALQHGLEEWPFSNKEGNGCVVLFRSVPCDGG